MIITEQQLIDFFSFEAQVFHPNESKHIRVLVKKIGVTFKDLLAEQKFQDFIKNTLTNGLVHPFFMSKELIELSNSLGIKGSKIDSYKQINQYLIFYFEYVQLIINNDLNDVLALSKLESQRENLPIYSVKKNQSINFKTFNKSPKLNVTKLNQLLKEIDLTILVSKTLGKIEPFLRYNESIVYAFSNEKIIDKKINFLGSLFELKKLVTILIERKLIFEPDNKDILLSKIFLVRGKEILPEQLTKPKGSYKRIAYLESIIQRCENK
jgi:hypothetical protein